MKAGRSIAAWRSLGVCLAVAAWAGSGTFGADQKTPSPEKLLPAQTILYIGWDGNDAHRDALQKTAAYKAIVESGLGDVVPKIFQWIGQEAGQQPVQMVQTALAHVLAKGAFVAVSIGSGEQGPPMPAVTIVVPGAAAAAEHLSGMILQNGPPEFRQMDADGRKVTRGLIRELPGLEVGFWAEGTHLVIAGGIGAVDPALGVAAGKSPNITTNAVWKKYQSKVDFENVLTGWLDLGKVRELAGGFPIPAGPNQQKPTTVNEVLAGLGLDKIGPLACRYGFKGEALWCETTLEAPSPRSGLLAFADQKPIALSELPPMPAGTDGFYAGRLDWSSAFQGMVRIGEMFRKQFDPPGTKSADDFLTEMKKELGIDLKKDLFDPLGDVFVLYGDPGQGVFGIGLGLGLAISVKDPKTLRATVDKLLARLGEEAMRDLRVKTTKRGKRQIRHLEFNDVPILSPAVMVDDKWLVLGMFPQTADSFALRLDGKLPKWEPSAELTKSLGELPKKYTSLTVSDPREGIRSAMSFGPMLLGIAQMSMNQMRRFRGGPGIPVEFPVSQADFPPSELVTRPLFTNLAVCSTTDKEIRWTSRSSFPAVPFLGGAGVGSGAGAAPVLLALLLPAVQQAREAARRSQSSNNLKQIGLGLHNYHDTFNGFPAGTHQNEKLKAEKRLSWMADELPFLEQAPLYNQLDFKKAWDDEPNSDLLKNRIPVFLNPSNPNTEGEYGLTHYVGMAGVGKEAPTLAVNDKRAGVFGYNRVTRIQNILDGTSNTICVTDLKADFGPWGAGGPSTVRALTKKPYINGPDGFGSFHAGGMSALFADGSVRFISENINADVLEALVTMAGGEAVGDF